MMNASQRRESANPVDRRFPLEWPVGWKRTPVKKRARSPYRVTPERAMREMFDSIRKMGARPGSIVLSTNIVLRNDGMPRLGVRAPEDTGVALYFSDRKGRARVIACDQWQHPHENMRAIGMAIDALRTLERVGASELLERAYQGFLALPAEAGPSSAGELGTGKRPWRTVMGFDPDGTKATPEWIRSVLRDRYRSLAISAHPDHVHGSVERFTELTLAYEEAKKECGLA